MTLYEPAIYVVVYVSYDYYRFQMNIGAATNAGEARTIAARWITERRDLSDLPVIDDAEQSEAMDESEARHILIERWPKA